MTNQSLENKLQAAGNPVEMLRNAPIGAYVFPDRPEYSNWRDEQRAWKETAILFDQSFHMTDLWIKGPDTRELLERLGVNSFATFGRNKAKQFVALNDDGYVIGDAVLFGFEDDEVAFVGRPAIPDWVQFNAETGGYDVEVTRDDRSLNNAGERLVFRYQVQGPTAGDVLNKVTGGKLPEIKFFNLGEFDIAGVRVRALNHSMSRVPGLELVGPHEHRDAVKEAILEAGAEFGLRQGGGRAYSTVAIESGWIPSPTPAIYSGETMKPYREWLKADSWEATLSIGGSFVSEDIEDYYQRPWDLGYGGLVKYDHDFIGREALEAVDGQTPKRRKVWLRWNDDDVQDVFASQFRSGEPYKYMDIPASHYATLPFDRAEVDGQLVGLSTYPVYTVNARGWFSLAMIDDTFDEGDVVKVIWGEPDESGKPVVERHVQREIRTTLSRTSPAA